MALDYKQDYQLKVPVDHETLAQKVINDVEVLNLAEELMGISDARTWLVTPNTAFYGDAPADWLHDERRDVVLNTLNAVKYGQYS